MRGRAASKTPDLAHLPIHGLGLELECRQTPVLQQQQGSMPRTLTLTVTPALLTLVHLHSAPDRAKIEKY